MAEFQVTFLLVGGGVAGLLVKADDLASLENNISDLLDGTAEVFKLGRGDQIAVMRKDSVIGFTIKSTGSR